MRQQQTHQQSSNANNSKSAGRSSCSSSTLPSSRGGGSSGSNTITNNNTKTSSSGMSTGSSAKNSSAPSSMKQAQGSNNSSSNNNQLSHQNSNTNNNTTTSNANNGLAAIGHNSSPILPMTPTSSVSPPANVICKKELSNSYGVNNGLSDVMKSAAIHDSIKEEMAGMMSNPIAYSNINARLGHGGNSTPLGSNSSIITTPSPPMTPSQNALSYVPNHDSYFWQSQYHQYPNSYNTPASYYSQVDYQGQSSYSMGHSGYATSNMGLTASNTFNGSMTSQPFASNGLDYMSPAPEKYGINMV